ncbi:MAG: hypothetical protein ACREEP_12605 [Dongiaceae bacterium]
MDDFRARHTAAALTLLAAALILIGAGGTLVGYMIGERQGERRATNHQAAMVNTLGTEWETYGSKAKQHFERTTDQLADALTNSATQLRAEVSMYHGCGGICTVIAYQFGQELVHASDSMRKAELPLLPEWGDALARATASSADSETVGSAADLSPLKDVGEDLAFSESSVRAALTLICGTIVVCFGIACFTALKLQSATGETGGDGTPRI